MTSTREVHEQTVAVLSDAVTELTRRAVEPTLAPFGEKLGETVTRLTAAVDAVDVAVHADRAERRKVVERLTAVEQQLSADRDDAKELAVRIVEILAAVRRQGGDLDSVQRGLSTLGTAVDQLAGGPDAPGEVHLLARQVATLRRLMIVVTVVALLTATAVGALGALILMRA